MLVNMPGILYPADLMVLVVKDTNLIAGGFQESINIMQTGEQAGGHDQIVIPQMPGR